MKFPCALAVATAGLIAVGCSADSPPIGPGDSACVTLRGEGQTSGDRHKLAGEGIFRFGDVVRNATVGLYLFQMREADGGIHVDTQYQFNWDNGDSFLTSDAVFFEPGLRPDEHTFEVKMRIVSGSGIFANMEGQNPVTLTATMQFGAPRNPGDARSAEEQFSVSGELCGT